MGYTPKKPEKNQIVCPFKFTIPENGIECNSNCGLFLPVQKCCSIQYNARMLNKIGAILDKRL